MSTNNKRRVKPALLLAFVWLITTNLFAQKKQTLMVGDPAPPLKYFKWLQGPNPITKLESDKIYVIEFWATWCGPCIAAMAHLSELAEKYEGKIDFIGCDVMENAYGGAKDQEAYFSKVTRFTEDQYKMGRMTYNVIMDNSAEDMNKNWLQAAGISGIPSSFVVSHGKIAWIGHPHYIDSILVAVLDGEFDIQAEREKQLERLKSGNQRNAAQEEAIAAYKAAEKEKDYKKALSLIDSAMSKLPQMRMMFVSDKFNILLNHFGVDEAVKFGESLKDDKVADQVLIANLYKEEDLPKRVLDFAIASMKQWTIQNHKVADILATFQFRAGYYSDAAQTQRIAVERAIAEKKDNPGLTEGVIADMQKKVEEYEQKAKSGK